MKTPTSLVTVFVAFAPLVVSTEKDFKEISSNVPQQVSVVNLQLPPDCLGQGGGKTGKYPSRFMFTIEPSTSDSVSVSTYPSDLVVAKGQGKDQQLRLVWNANVANDAKEGGVKISLPANQLVAVSAEKGAFVQILNGFTSIERITVATDAKLFATLTTSLTTTTSNLTLSVTAGGQANVISNASVSRLDLSNYSRLSLQAPSVGDLSATSEGIFDLKGNVGHAQVSTSARVTIDGDLSEGGTISSGGKMTVYGKASGHFEVSTDANFLVGEELLGTVDATSGAKVYAPMCDNVATSTGASCSTSTTKGGVSINVPIQPFTRTGSDTCSTEQRRGWMIVSDDAQGWMLGFVVAVLAVVTLLAVSLRFGRNSSSSSRHVSNKTGRSVVKAGSVGRDISLPSESC